MRWIRDQILHVLPVFIFFLIAFTAINYTVSYLLLRAGISPISFLNIVIAAALIAKIVLVIDNLPWIDLFPKKPLIYNTLWKTFVYWTLTLIIRLILRFFPYLFNHTSFENEMNNFAKHFDWRLFSSVQSFYLMLIFVFVTARELTLIIGPLKIRKIFFGR